MTYWTFNFAIMIVSGAFTAIIGIYAYMHIRERGARFLAWLMLFTTLNACGSILERLGSSMAQKLFWFNFSETVHIMTLPVCLFFVMDYTGMERMLKRRRFTLPVLLYFILWASFLWTDSYHHLLRYDLTVQDRVLMFTSTNLSLFLNIISFMAVIVALCYLGVYVGKSGPLARKQALWMWLAAALPILWVIVGFASPLSPQVWGVYTTVINVLMGLCMFMAIFKYKLLSAVPIAKDHIVEMMQDGVLVVDGKGSVIDSNASARRWFAEMEEGAAEVTGRSIRELLAPWPQWRSACERLQQDEFEIEVGEGKNGSEQRVYTIKIMPLYSTGRRILGTVSILSDNTEDRRRYEQAEQMNRFKDELFGIVTHDIRDPLVVLLNLTEMLEEERSRLSADSAEVLDTVKDKANTTFTMVENLLEWVRCQRGGMTLHARSIPLSSIVNETASLFAGKREAKKISFQNEVDDGIQVYADREAVSLVLRNLLANAIKFTKSGGRVSVGAEESEDRVMITVRDTGIGMGPDRMNLLFGDLPVSSIPGTTGERGTGIGLLLCKELVRLIGGEIGVSSVPGEGSAFYFSIPTHSSSISRPQDAAS